MDGPKVPLHKLGLLLGHAGLRLLILWDCDFFPQIFREFLAT